jgi:hypothetical protein
MCALTHTLFLDEEGLYDPCPFNDRLLLGLKGAMSEAELCVMRARLQGGILNKARRGALKLTVPIGLCSTQADAIVLDPDRAAYQPPSGKSFAALSTQGLPVRPCATFTNSICFSRTESVADLIKERSPGDHFNTTMCCGCCTSLPMRAPMSSGAPARGISADGKIHSADLPRSEWVTRVKDAHVGYSSWEEVERNEAQLAMNSPGLAPERFSAPREGPALLQGLILCATCGERMTVRYHQRAGKPYRARVSLSAHKHRAGERSLSTHSWV